MNETIVFGDLHVREEEPFKSVFVSFVEWFKKQTFNTPDNTAIFLGDIFHQEYPTPTEVLLVLDFFLNVVKMKSIVLRGNHDMKRLLCGLDFLDALATHNVTVIKKPSFMEINGSRCLLLPHYDVNIFTDFRDMKKDYSKNGLKGLLKDEELTNLDYVFGHFASTPAFGEEIDISWLPGRKVMGHIHLASLSADYLGTPYITRYDERNKASYYLVIEGPKKNHTVPIPMFFNYYALDYGKGADTIPDKAPLYLLDILKAPSRESAEEFYKGEYIHKIYTVVGRTITIVDKENMHDKKSVETYTEEYVKTANVEEDLAEKIVSLVKSN